MTGNSKRSIRLLSWRTLRWVVTLPALPLVWWACTSHPLAQPTPAPEQQTNIRVTVKPNRQLDLVFMVDNSPSMAPKQAKMNAQFPGLINALKDPSDGTLPDLRVAIIDSDLGTGGPRNGAGYSSGTCGPKTLPDGTVSDFGDVGHFQMIGASGCGVNSADALFLEYKTGAPVNYTGDISKVFGCLAGNLGTAGCGEEHQLQAFEFALYIANNKTQQDLFLRPSAYLGLVFLSDEDDCSAATNEGMFGPTPLGGPGGTDLSNESASLRCYTRSHSCNGKNLSDSPPGYPTNAPFATALTNCSARIDVGDQCSNPTDDPNNPATDTSLPTSCNPLKSIKVLADHIKAIKGAAASDHILVAGIFGWPATDTEMANAQYKIDMVPNPTTQDTAHPKVYDSWPVCYDPSHPAPKDGSFDTVAAGWGATAGLRMSAFIDQFGTNGLKFSICQADFADSMKQIGDILAKKLTNLCVDYKLYDTDLDPTNGVQPSCRVAYRDPTTGIEDQNSLPECGTSAATADKDCWQLSTDKGLCPATGQLVKVVRPAGADATNPLAPGTQVSMYCRTCTDFNAPVGSDAYKACSYSL